VCLVDVGGRRLAASVRGAGDPFVLLEVGFGAESESWAAVAEGVAAFARVCWYDRAGRGASGPPARRPRSPDDLLADVHALLHSPIAATPCVYVGQSFGGLMARLYAARHPEDVAGMVLVDSLHEDQFDECGPHFPPAAEGEPPLLTGMRAFWSGGWRDPAQNKEGIDMLACREAGHAVRSFGDMPLAIVTANSFGRPPLFPPAEGARLQEIWEDLQGRFTRLSSRATRELVADSGHFVQVDRPDAVVAAIERVVQATRDATAAGR
jgi:pimeloyl-ACP methyl ester carboxylesterase